MPQTAVLLPNQQHVHADIEQQRFAVILEIESELEECPKPSQRVSLPATTQVTISASRRWGVGLDVILDHEPQPARNCQVSGMALGLSETRGNG